MSGFGRKKGLKVDVYNNKIDEALRRLKKIIERENIVKDIRSHEYFESKGQKKRRRKMAAKFRQMKQTKMEKEM